MANSIQVLTRNVRRRLMLAYVAREAAWRVLLVMAAVLAWRCWPGAWALPWLVAGVLLVHWMIRWRGPGELASAMEIDRQLALKELISSGLLARDGEGLAAAVREQAEARAGQIDPRELHAGRVGLRYWIAALLLSGIVAAIPSGGAGSRQELAVANSDAPAVETNEVKDAAARERRQPQAPRPIGSAESDFASVMEMPAEGRGGKPGAAHASRAEMGGEGAGAGLATGGRQSPSSGEATLAMADQPREGDGQGRSGAGAARGDVGNVAGTGTVSGGSAANGESARGGGRAAPADGRDIELRAIPARYREIVRAYYAR